MNDDMKKYEEPEEEAGSIDEPARTPKRKERPVRPGRLYVTGIVTGILLVTVVMLLCDVLNFHPFSRTPVADDIYDLTSTLETYIENYYWKSDTSPTEFTYMAAKGMVAALQDPYSAYLTPDELTKNKEHNDGDYAGIGVMIGEDATTHRKFVTEIVTDGPSDKAGMKVDDEVVAVDGEDVSQETTDQLVARIRGKVGVTHVITVLRIKGAVTGSAASVPAEDKERIDLTVVTDKIVNKSIKSQLLKDKIGYIQIASFDRETPKQFNEAVDALEKQDIRGLILDVRGNPGGVLSSVLDVLDRLLAEGPLLTETRKGQKDTIYRSSGKEHFDKPMAVLINSKSASAAEVFAGALQDRNKTPLVGEKSYGKGIMQSIFPLSDEQGGIKLTTGEYLLPSGRSIHEKGLTPDEELSYTGTEEDYGTEKDNQLQKAVEVMKKQIK